MNEPKELILLSQASQALEQAGTVDEVNAAIGLARLHTEQLPDAMLARMERADGPLESPALRGAGAGAAAVAGCDDQGQGDE